MQDSGQGARVPRKYKAARDATFVLACWVEAIVINSVFIAEEGESTLASNPHGARIEKPAHHFGKLLLAIFLFVKGAPCKGIRLGSRSDTL